MAQKALLLESTFTVQQMDCPSEERLIRLKLEAQPQVKGLNFNLEKRQLTVYHTQPVQTLKAQLAELKLGEHLENSQATTHNFEQDQTQEQKILRWVLGINALFFAVELSTGLWAHSMGLVADSLDMLADALVYGLSLGVVSGSLRQKKKVATAAGYLQLLLAVLGLTEVLRRFFGAGEVPHHQMMMVVAVLAAVANGLCLYLLQQAKNQKDAHMKASMIFTSNDLLINLGVVTAGLLVYALDSPWPDLLIGAFIFIWVSRAALRILKLGK